MVLPSIFGLYGSDVLLWDVIDNRNVIGWEMSGLKEGEEEKRICWYNWMRKEVYNINHQKRTEGERGYTDGEINLVCQIWEEHLG
jgi:hypothetical protein